MHFSALFVIATAVVSGFAQKTVSDVTADIAKVSTQVTALDNSITAFPATGGTLANALAIHTAATNLKSTIDSSTSDVKAVSPTPVSEADGQSILASVNAFEPTIEHALVGIVEKKAALEALPLGSVPGIVKQDLADLRTSTSAFANALIDTAPADLTASATALRDKIDAAFVKAQAAYP